MRDVALRRWEEHEISLQMIKPYLAKFQELNPGSTVKWETRGVCMERIFVCPGIMKTSLRHVRPVMSLDAAHLKSKWKGTLYTASVKTGSDEIYPVAIGVMNGNENESGWTWFLQLLDSAIELLVMDWPNEEYRYKYFTFISDRQKGLVEALQKVFPHNHSCFCAIHIARNAEKHGGKRVAQLVHGLSTTFSKYLSANLLESINKISPKGREYLEKIPPEQWRSTSWSDAARLPPRYGIVTSNMSESTNNMFAGGREGSWLLSIDFILGKMMERIAFLRKHVKGKEGILECVAERLQNSWDTSAGYTVVELGNDGNSYSVSRQGKKAVDSSCRYTVNILKRKCTCGEWQEHGIPCVDALACFRLQKCTTLDEVQRVYVDSLYTYANAQDLLSMNIMPVCMDEIAPDGETLPPKKSSKRTSGRPKKLRIRKRSKFADNPEESNVVCSKCKRRGHNIRTCATREWLEKEAAKKKAKTNDTLDLS